MTTIGDSWSPYGLERDPYFQEALEPNQDGSYPIALFVGRTAETTLLARQVVGAPTSRAILAGDAGVGKTTVVSKLKAILAAEGVLTHARPVRVMTGMTAQEFAADVLRQLLQIRATLNETSHATRGHRESSGDVAFWHRIQQLVEGEDILGGGLGALGTSVTVSRSRVAAEQHHALPQELAGAFARLAKRAPRRGKNGGVLVHVNNLENLTRHETQAATTLMTNLRDYFLLERSHWIFVGASHIDHTVFGDPAVHSTIPLTTHLDPLSVEDVQTLLDLRYRHLATRRRPTPPVAPEGVAELYGRYRGNLRGFLRLLSMAVQRYPAGDSARSLSAQDVLTTVAAEYWRALLRTAGATDAASLRRVVEQGRGVRLRNTDVRVATQLTVPAAKALIDRWLRAGVVLADGTEGKSVYYRLSGDAQVAFGR